MSADDQGAPRGVPALSTLAQLGKAIGKRADNELTSSSRLATATQLSSQSSAGTGHNTGNWSTQQALRKYSA